MSENWARSWVWKKIDEKDFDTIARTIIGATDNPMSDLNSIATVLVKSYYHRRSFSSWNAIVRIVERCIEERKGYSSVSSTILDGVRLLQDPDLDAEESSGKIPTM